MFQFNDSLVVCNHQLYLFLRRLIRNLFVLYLADKGIVKACARRKKDAL